MQKKQVKQPKPKANPNASNKPVVKRVNQQPKNKASKAPFLSALIDPFNPTSIGCTVPDPFPFATVPYHIHQTTVVGPPVSSSITSGAIMFLPNPLLSMIDLQHTLSLTGSNVSIQSTPMTVFNVGGTSPGSCVYGACSAPNLSSILSTYRTVSWGVKISNLQPELSATGRLIIGFLPIGDTVPSFSDFQAATLSSVFTPITNIPNTVLASSTILELPTAFEITVQDLLSGDLEISGMYTNSNFWTFKANINQGAAPNLMGDDVTVNGVGSVTSIGYKDITRCVGGCAIVIYYEGFPLPSTISNMLQFETIYHLEGSPQLAVSGNAIPVASMSVKPNVGSSVALENSMQVASKESNVVHWISKGAQFLNNNKTSIMSGLSAAANLAKFAALA